MEIIAKEAALLSIIEIGLGGLLHAFSIPLGGHFLSLNQTYFLSRSVRKHAEETRLLPFYVSNTAALIKLVTPIGKKLTPMLAIAAQGFLFSIGTFFFGNNLLGAIVGAALASPWSIVQPFLLSYLLFGESLVHAAQFYFDQIHRYFAIEPQHLGIVLASLVLFKMVLSVIATALGARVSEEKATQYENSVITMSSYNGVFKEKPEGFWENVRASFKELLSPWFLTSLAFTGVFFYFAESEHSQLARKLLQPVALAFILVLFFRLLPWKAFRTVRATLEVLRRMRT